MVSLSSKLRDYGILVEHVVDVSDFPREGRLVLNGQDFEEIHPSDVGFKSYHILDCFFVVRAKEN